MASRGQTVTLQYVAWDTNANAGATGDVGSHTLRWIKDGTAATPTNSPAEVDATNAPGVYKLTLTAAECTCDVGTLAGKSGSANVVIIPLTITFEQLPTVAAGAASGVALVGSAMALTSSERNSVADTVLSRNVSNVEASAPEHSLCTTVLMALENVVSSNTLTIKRTDGSTTHVTKTVGTTSNAGPITSIS